ncbi:sensor histidine kinase [Streptodolium elevatio]|uniref:histidine kinase n=1 Tax=Streptodolium elevatio TaxID=3157996 RepID=A0ABV3DUM1_9ACTN
MKLTLRARLTVMYGGMFLVAGIVLLGLTYALFHKQLDRPQLVKVATDTPAAALRDEALVQRQVFAVGGDGELYAGEAARQEMQEYKDHLRDAATTSMITQGGVALAIVGGLAAGFGWLIAGRVLRPLHRVTDTARRIAAAPAANRGLRERIALSGPDDEVKELAETFDRMVERLDRSFDGQRRFVANASHELRTPLTLGRALVEVAMHKRTASDDVRQLGARLLEISTRHERLISGLLALADAENELTERAPVDLADIVGHVVTQSASAAAHAGVTVDEHPGESTVVGDALLLERLVHNLVENSIRHNIADGWVTITSRTLSDGRAQIEVANSGDHIEPGDVPALFEPFRRAGRHRPADAGGAGLGLSIVQAVTRAHGGDVTAHPRPDGGLTVTATFPGVTWGRPACEHPRTTTSAPDRPGAFIGPPTR